MTPWPMRRQLLVTAIIASVTIAGWYGHAPAVAFLTERGVIGAKAEKSERRRRGGNAVPVIVARAGVATNDATLIAIGTGRARRTATLYTETDGIVSAVKVRAGDRVSKGDVILELDPTKAELAVAVAKQKMTQASRMRDRAAYLKRRSVQSNAQLDDAQNTLAVAELELKQAQEALRDTKIRAPFSGVVSLPEVEIGDRVTTSARVASIDDRSEILVEFEVPEVYFARMTRGMPVTAKTAAYAGRTFDGELITIDARVQTETRTVRVRGAFPNGDDALRPGMSFSMRLMFPGDEHTSIPELALQYDQGNAFVWRVTNGRASKVAVSPLKRSNATALVDGPLAPGDLVVVEGVQRVREGRAVAFDDLAPVENNDADGEVSKRTGSQSAGQRG